MLMNKDLCKKVALFAVAGSTLLLSACTNEPIEVNPSSPVRDALTRSEEKYGKNDYSPWGFGLCYSSTMNTPSEVLNVAQQRCGNGRLEYRGDDKLWNDCPVFQHVRASFVCYPLPKERPASGG